MTAAAIRIGVDVGGTFTDLVAVDDAGKVTLAKSPSTPADQSIGVIEGLRRLAERLGLDLPELLRRTERIVHGTTVATNALLERKGAKVGLLTTAGHRDVLEMREGLKEDRYNLRMPPPEPLVPRHLRLGVRERLRADGRVETPLDEASLRRAVARLEAAQVEAVAVCYLHAYRDARHERATRRFLAAALPGAYVSLSSEVLPQIKEYGRVLTTVVNAYVGPIVERYLVKLKRRLAESGYRGPLFIVLSHGGIAPVEEAARLAAGTVLSGPAGGVAGARRSAELLDLPDLIPFDMGGTSTDISLIAGGRPALSAERGLAGQRIALRSLDIISIGAGGGSIARVDAGKALHVGPESAGADPGPACYGKGGAMATVTDANLVLGYLDPKGFLGGGGRLDADAAATAVDGIAAALDVDRVTAAAGIHRVVNTRMAEGIRLMTVRRGVDPRRFALLSFGGAAGLHATAIARELDIARVVVPRVASVLSAWGMLATDLRYEVSRTHVGDVARLDDRKLRRVFDEMEREGRKRLGAWFGGAVHALRAAEMRYGEQIFEIDVPLDGIDWQSPHLLADVVARFHERHEALYTYSIPDQEVVLVNARVAVIGEMPALPEQPRLAANGGESAPRRRRIHLGAWREVPVYDWDALGAGREISGPALIETETTTVLLREGDRLAVNALGWLDIRVAAARRQSVAEMPARATPHGRAAAPAAQ
ncbi:MAG TPA: hydantoinase/oxoprolinase family protein [Alphaproteobacteria bacterium]|nr:hydantoinase/oxoprolinase family protein [Alphaproteobacteria bacterium]